MKLLLFVALLAIGFLSVLAAPKQCQLVGEYVKFKKKNFSSSDFNIFIEFQCQVYFDCCSKRCMSYIYRCVSSQDQAEDSREASSSFDLISFMLNIQE